MTKESYQKFIESNQIKEIREVTPERTSQYWGQLFQQYMSLLEEGWDEEAFIAYLAFVKELPVPDESEGLVELDDLKRQTQLIGSEIYRQMFRNSQLSSREKVQLLLRQLGAELDENEFLQLTGTHVFDSALSPHSGFLEELASCVKTAYPKGLIASSYGEIPAMELKKVHQLRYYIDRQNLFYIRRSFAGATDYDKLLAYAAQTGQRLIYRDTSRFHNRVSYANYQKRLKERLKQQENDKIKTANGLSEFIIHVKTGAFVSQWNHLRTKNGNRVFIEKDKEVIALSKEKINSSSRAYDLAGKAGKSIGDTESFNYDRGFLDWLPWRRAHDRYDMKPAGQEKFDSDLRKAAKRRWPFPDRYWEKYNRPKDIEKDRLIK